MLNRWLRFTLQERKMKILLTTTIILLSCLKVLSQNLDFEKKAAIDSIVRNVQL